MKTVDFKPGDVVIVVPDSIMPVSDYIGEIFVIIGIVDFGYFFVKVQSMATDKLVYVRDRNLKLIHRCQE